MGLVWTILIGFLVGTIAKVLVPGKESGGFIVTTLLGIGGSWVGGWLFGLLGTRGPAGFIGSVLGAILILLIHRWWTNRARAV
jgi:uncharacterized membrane protein YeaQ/YmgE (transglycosylase-associated protein family)